MKTDKVVDKLKLIAKTTGQKQIKKGVNILQAKQSDGVKLIVSGVATIALSRYNNLPRYRCLKCGRFTTLKLAGSYHQCPGGSIEIEPTDVTNCCDTEMYECVNR